MIDESVAKPPADKAPVPDAAAQERLTKEIKELFKQDYAKPKAPDPTWC